MERFGPTAGCKACEGRGGARPHDCHARGVLDNRSASEGASTSSPMRALQPDADSLAVTSHDMEVDDAQTAAQEAQARQVLANRVG